MFRDIITWISTNLFTIIRKCLFSILSVGKIPFHVAFILDGNRRFAKKHNSPTITGHESGYKALTKFIRYSFDLGIKYVTVYAFSIDNFNRQLDEVQSLMKLMQDSMEDMMKEDSIVYQYDIKVHVAGDLTLLTQPLRSTAARLMEATRDNKKTVLSICIAYTSTNEILRAVQGACQDKITQQIIKDGFMVGHQQPSPHSGLMITLEDVEKNMDLAIAPDPDIIVRTSGETRLSNFLLWQSSGTLLYSPAVLWPEISIWHLLWVVLNFQKMHFMYTHNKKQP